MTDLDLGGPLYGFLKILRHCRRCLGTELGGNNKNQGTAAMAPIAGVVGTSEPCLRSKEVLQVVSERTLDRHVYMSTKFDHGGLRSHAATPRSHGVVRKGDKRTLVTSPSIEAEKGV